MPLRLVCALTLPVLLLLSACHSPSRSIGQGDDDLRPLARRTLALAAERYGRSAQALDPADGYPRTNAPDGGWKRVAPSDWTSGFYPGILWQLYEHTRDNALRSQAHRWTLPLVEIFEGAPDHDLGFQFYCSFGHGYRITGDPAYTGPLLTAAEKLAARFNPKVGVVKSWDWSSRWAYPVIADNMMNLELLLWGADHGGQAAWKNIARSHAHKTIQNHFRPDGGSYHVVDYDPETGLVRERVTHQGAADHSTWARGQAWLIYGFTMMARQTGDAAFLEQAQKAADYYIARLPEDAVPYWDFQAPGIPEAPRDASAAAIVASALLELEGLAPAAKGREYHQAAVRMLRSLLSPAYLAPEGSVHLLDHAVGNHPGNSEIDAALIYADYYFVEALQRYLNLTDAN